MATMRGAAVLLVVLLGVVSGAAATSASESVTLAKQLDASLQAASAMEEVSAAAVAELAASSAQLVALLEKEHANRYTVWNVLDVVMEFAYGELVCTGHCLWSTVSPAVDVVVRAAQPLVQASVQALRSAFEAVSRGADLASARSAKLYTEHAEPAVGEHVAKARAFATDVAEQVINYIKKTRASGIQWLLERDPANEAFAEVAVDAFIVSQGGMLAIVVGWLITRTIFSTLAAFLGCFCARRTTTRQRTLRNRVSTAKARQQQQQQEKHQKKKTKKKKKKKSNVQTQDADSSDGDDDDLDYEQFSKKRRR